MDSERRRDLRRDIRTSSAAGESAGKKRILEHSSQLNILQHGFRSRISESQRRPRLSFCALEIAFLKKYAAQVAVCSTGATCA